MVSFHRGRDNEPDEAGTCGSRERVISGCDVLGFAEVGFGQASTGHKSSERKVRCGEFSQGQRQRAR